MYGATIPAFTKREKNPDVDAFVKVISMRFRPSFMQCSTTGLVRLGANIHDMIDAIGPRPFKGDPAYEEYLARRKQDKKEHEASEEKNDLPGEEDDDDSAGVPLNPGLA